MKNEAAAITWTYEPSLEGYLAHFDLEVRCEFESGFKGDVTATVELFHGDDGSDEARFFLFEGGREVTCEFEEESGALSWELDDACERAFEALRATGAITSPVSVAA